LGKHGVGSILEVPSVGQCEGKRRVYRAHCPDVPDNEHPTWIANSCVCNEMHGLLGRVLRTVPPSTVDGVASAVRASKWLTGKIRAASGGVITPVSYQQVYEKYAGSKRKTYELAHAWILRHGGAQRQHAKVSSFIKAEKSYADPKAPRVIQARDPIYNLEIGTFLKPIEHAIYNLTSFKWMGGGSKYSGGFKYTRIVAKGMNNYERARTIASKMTNFEDCVVYSLDCTKFDAHVSLNMLRRVEHAAYLRLINDSNFQRLLGWQTRNRGRTSGGIKYCCEGCRMSGDVNTASGNVFQMLCMILGYGRELGIRFDVLDDGDDCLLFIEARDEPLVNSTIEAAFLKFGHELKLENRATELQDVVFCRSKPTYVELPTASFVGANRETGGCKDSGWVMVRDYRHVLKQSLVSHRHYDQPTKAATVMRAVGESLSTMYQGVPVLQSFAHAILRGTSHVVSKGFDHRSGLGYRHYHEYGSWQTKECSAVPVSLVTRTFFERTWGLPIDQQLRLEAYYDSMRGIEPPRELTDVGEDAVPLCDGSWFNVQTGHVDPELFNWERLLPGRRGGIIDLPSGSTAG